MHKILLKALAGKLRRNGARILNNSNYFIQFLKYSSWERIEQLLRAERENSDAVDDNVCADDGSVNVGESHAIKEARSRSEAMHAFEIGPRCPLLFMGLNRSSLHHTAAT